MARARARSDNGKRNRGAATQRNVGDDDAASRPVADADVFD
jgi:hypothetical protein